MTNFDTYDKCVHLMVLMAEHGFNIKTDQFNQRFISADIHHINWKDYGFIVNNEWTLVKSVEEAIAFIDGVMAMKNFEKLKAK